MRQRQKDGYVGTIAKQSRQLVAYLIIEALLPNRAYLIEDAFAFSCLQEHIYFSFCHLSCLWFSKQRFLYPNKVKLSIRHLPILILKSFLHASFLSECIKITWSSTTRDATIGLRSILRRIMPPKKNTLDWKCRNCKLSAEAILGDLAYKADWKGLNLVHERLCQGLSSKNEPLGLPSDCPACRKPIGKTRTPLGPTPSAWETHWRKCQSGLPLSDTFGLQEIRGQFQKYLLPSLDMNAKFGLLLSSRAVVLDDTHLKSLAENLRLNPVQAAYKTKDLVMKYREEFS